MGKNDELSPDEWHQLLGFVDSMSMDDIDEDLFELLKAQTFGQIDDVPALQRRAISAYLIDHTKSTCAEARKLSAEYHGAVPLEAIVCGFGDLMMRVGIKAGHKMSPDLFKKIFPEEA